MARGRTGVVSVVAGVILGLAGAAHGASIVVDTTVDAIDANGDCSLREAVRAANLDVAVDGCVAGDPGAVQRFHVRHSVRLLRRERCARRKQESQNTENGGSHHHPQRSTSARI